MVVSRFQEGNRLVRNGQLEEAIAAYKEAIEQNPSFYWAYQNLGEVLWKLSHLEESVQVYQAAIQCNPTAAWSYYHLGRVLEALGKQQEAQFNYKKAVELHASLKQESQESQIITVKEDLKGSKESGQSIDFQIPSHKSPEEVIKDLREKKRKRKSRKEDSNVVLSEVYVPRVDCILFPVIKRELKDLLNYFNSILPLSQAKNSLTIVFSIDHVWEKSSVEQIRALLKQSDAGGCIKEVKFISCRLAEKESVYIRKIPKEISKMEIHPYGLKSGPNLQFFRSLQELMASESEYTSVLLQEVDTIPLKVHWIDSINKEIAGLNNALLIGTNYSGASRLNSEQVNHINGNAIYCLGNPAFKNFLFLWEILVVEVCKKAPWNAYDTATEWAIEYIDDDSRWTLDRKKCQDSPYFQSQEFRQYLDLYHTNTHKLNQLVNKAGPFELMVCTVLEPSAIADQLRAASVLHLRPALPFRDICRYVANDHQFCGVNVIGHDALWQYPAITEQYAYEKAKKYLRSYDKSIVYFGFPWATLIDYFLHKPENAPLVLLTLERYKPYLKQFSRVITVCQHIHLLKFQYLFSQLGITDIFWCHAVKGQSTLPNYFDISLHPFPLYPVQACNASPVVEPRKYLFSFVGSYAPNYYLTDSRNKIIDFLSSDDRGLVISRDQWHYQKVVYDHQVKRSSQGTDKMIDTSASEQFQTAMKQSKFALCPSGSGPNSIRLWEAIGLGAIPVVLADTYLPPGDLSLWDEATITCRETLEDIKALPDYLAKLEEDPAILERKRHALRQLWMIYGPDCFIYDIINHFLTLQQLEMTNNVA